MEFTLDLKAELNQEFQECAELFQKGFFKDAYDVLVQISYPKLSSISKFQYQVIMGVILYNLGDYGASEEWLSKSVPDKLDLNNQYLYILGSVHKAMNWLRMSKLNEGINQLNTLLPEVLSLKFEDLEALIYNWLGNAFLFKWNLKESLNYHKMSLSICRRTDNLDTAKSLNNIGLIYRVQGNFKKAIEIFNEGLAVKFENNEAKSFLLSNRSISHFELGEFELALQDQKASYKLRTISGAKYLIADSLFNLVRITNGLNDSDLCLTYYKKLIEIPNDPGIRALKSMASVYALKDRDPFKILECWKQALEYLSLEFGYKILCYEEMISIQINQNINSIQEILASIDEFETLAENNKLYPSLVKIRIVKGMIYKDLFEIQNAKECFEDALVISSEFGFPSHEKLARQELLNLNEHINKFDTFYKTENHEPEVRGEDVLSYIKNFKNILEEFS